MFTPPDRTEAQDQFLAEFTELAIDLARDAGKCAKETGDAHEKAQLMLAVERLGRSLRLTIALQRRLVREARTQRTEAVETRRNQIRTVLHAWQPSEAILKAVRDGGARLVVLETGDAGVIVDEALAKDGLQQILRRNLEAISAAAAAAH